SRPTLSGGNVAFIGSLSNNVSGVYTTVGAPPLAKVVDTNTNNSQFSQFLDASISNGKTVFLGTDANLKRSIYSDLTGQLKKVVDTTDAVPGAANAVNFDVLLDPTMDGNKLVFQNRSAGVVGLYKAAIGNNVTLSKVISTDDAIAGNDKFTFFGDASIDGGNIAFTGQGDPDHDTGDTRKRGIYADFGGSLIKLDELTTS